MAVGCRQAIWSETRNIHLLLLYSPLYVGCRASLTDVDHNQNDSRHDPTLSADNIGRHAVSVMRLGINIRREVINAHLTRRDETESWASARWPGGCGRWMD